MRVEDYRTCRTHRYDGSFGRGVSGCGDIQGQRDLAVIVERVGYL